MLSLLNGCEVRLVTDSVDARAKYYARAMRLRLGLRLAFGKCRANNSIEITPMQNCVLPVGIILKMMITSFGVLSTDTVVIGNH